MNFKEFNQYIDEVNNYETNWSVKKALLDKVDANGVFKDFYGDTIVFKLNEKDKKVVKNIQDIILEDFDDYVTKLNPEIFHLTLQSLSNKYTTLYGGIEEINKEIIKNKELVKFAFQEIASKYKGCKLNMQVSSLNISNQGITLYMKPLTEEDFDILMGCKEIVDKYDYHSNKEVEKYIPHITFTYFTPLKESKYEEILKKVKKMNTDQKETIIISLEIDRLTYYYHHDMNDFRPIFQVDNFR